MDERLEVAFQHFLEGLSEAWSVMDGGQPRNASRGSLLAVLRFLNVVDHDDPGGRSRPLVNLLEGLASLDSGTVVPLLRPAPIRGAPHEPVGVQALKALA